MSACEVAAEPDVDAEGDDEEMVNEANSYDRLPFVVGFHDKPRCFWAPRPTGNYTYDCTLGREYGRAVLSMLIKPGGHQLLRWIVWDMVRHGDADRDAGLIVGMMGEIGEMLEAAGR